MNLIVPNIQKVLIVISHPVAISNLNSITFPLQIININPRVHPFNPNHPPAIHIRIILKPIQLLQDLRTDPKKFDQNPSLSLHHIRIIIFSIPKHRKPVKPKPVNELRVPHKSKVAHSNSQSPINHHEQAHFYKP